jgi:hypothetical protein
MSNSPESQELLDLNSAYKTITGNDFFLYLSRPGDGQNRFVFTDTVKFSRKAAVAHMKAKLAEVSNG